MRVRTVTRLWSIGVRTTVGFAVSAMALTTGVLVFVALASQWSLRAATEFRPTALSSAATPSVGRDPHVDPSAVPSGAVAFVQVAAEQQWQWSAVGIAVAGVLAGLLGWVLSRQVLRPIDRMARTADRISASTLHERIALDGPDDELRRLARTVDALLDRLEAAFASQRRFVAQAAHELRTPLAVQRASVQIGLPDDATPAELAAVRAELLEQNRRTEHLVDSLLVLAEAERGLEDRSTAVDLGAVARDVVAQAAGAARDADVTLVVDEQDVPRGLTGEPLLVRQLVGNLVDNAIEYNEPGGTVLVRTGVHGVTVENTGVLVDPDEVQHLTEPFRRGEHPGSKRHSGLGLSIVAAIADAHGWSLRLEPLPDGGLRAVVGVSSV
ncbi:HAMP domain-containing histidine kinase [Curtobacterium sp. ODYSSEY 48 V2]|uniref:sensor histidine kinase n=1 Tax=unclassified Curtobacterium TaxID=257496 RepID=UPI00203D8116|nr:MULTISPECIES: HAMP domain-containing sensor histidine kinase [unclassified Curtobacterium]MCM3503539.1 HAMP domain-containing histidine kinase [Curtobacterium sp. ODYSSEY 48 V2]MDB6428479.1 HAMP domain-containing sensor histidine kinase [Curtobacterium sp. 20TX0008]